MTKMLSFSPLTDEETEAQSDYMPCPKSHSEEAVEPGFKLRQAAELLFVLTAVLCSSSKGIGLLTTKITSNLSTYSSLLFFPGPGADPRGMFAGGLWFHESLELYLPSSKCLVLCACFIPTNKRLKSDRCGFSPHTCINYLILATLLNLSKPHFHICNGKWEC